MHWLELHIDTVHAGLETVTEFLSALGVDSVVIEDAEDFHTFLEENRQAWDYVDEALEKKLRGSSRVTFYLPEDDEGFGKLAEIRIALQSLKESRRDLGTLLMTLDTVKNEDWENNWKQYYRPMDIGTRLRIVPKWEAETVQAARNLTAGQTETQNAAAGKPEARKPTAANAKTRQDADRIPLLLDPGLTFGTGMHASTRLCLRALERCLPPGGRVLDLGCGSGILSIAAMKLGAGEAAAVDIDPLCLRTARENADLNGIPAERYRIYTGDILSDAELRREIGGGYDLVLANIVADVILRLAPMVSSLLAPGGVFLCSGVIEGRAAEVAGGLRANGLLPVETEREGDWYAFTCAAKAFL